MKIKTLLVAAASSLLLAVASPAIAQQPPNIDAASALLVDARDGHALYKDGVDTRREVASTTKLMTALLALEELPLDRVLTAPRYTPSSPAESLANLRTGERMEVADLLRALLLESANDAAATLADGVAGSQRTFVRQMNRRARRLGLRGTHYENPIGLDDPQNYSTARDLARLTRRLMRNKFFAETVRMPKARLLTGAYPRTIENRNDLVGRYPWVTGVKTGHTRQAEYVLVGSGTRNRVSLVSVVLGAPSAATRNAGTLALFNYGFSRFKQVQPLSKGATVAKARVDFHRGREVELTAQQTVALAIRREQRVRLEVVAPRKLKGPIAAGETVGTIDVMIGGRKLQTVALVTAEQVPGANILQKAAFYVLRWPILLALALIAAIFLVRRRRRQASAEAARRRRRRAARLE